MNLSPEVHSNNLKLTGKKNVRWAEREIWKTGWVERRWQSEKQNKVSSSENKPTSHNWVCRDTEKQRDFVKHAASLTLCLPKKGKRRNKIKGLTSFLLLSSTTTYVLHSEHCWKATSLSPALLQEACWASSATNTAIEKLFISIFWCIVVIVRKWQLLIISHEMAILVTSWLCLQFQVSWHKRNVVSNIHTNKKLSALHNQALAGWSVYSVSSITPKHYYKLSKPVVTNVSKGLKSYKWVSESWFNASRGCWVPPACFSLSFASSPSCVWLFRKSPMNSQVLSACWGGPGGTQHADTAIAGTAGEVQGSPAPE